MYHLLNDFINTSGPIRENNVHHPTNNFSRPGSSQNNQPLNNRIYQFVKFVKLFTHKYLFFISSNKLFIFY